MILFSKLKSYKLRIFICVISKGLQTHDQKKKKKTKKKRNRKNKRMRRRKRRRIRKETKRRRKFKVSYFHCCIPTRLYAINFCKFLICSFLIFWPVWVKTWSRLKEWICLDVVGIVLESGQNLSLVQTSYFYRILARKSLIIRLFKTNVHS